MTNWNVWCSVIYYRTKNTSDVVFLADIQSDLHLKNDLKTFRFLPFKLVIVPTAPNSQRIHSCVIFEQQVSKISVIIFTGESITGYMDPDDVYFNCYIRTPTVADPGFPRGGAANPPGGRQHTILPKFPKNCMKLKEFRRGGGVIWVVVHIPD